MSCILYFAVPSILLKACSRTLSNNKKKILHHWKIVQEREQPPVSEAERWHVQSTTDKLYSVVRKCMDLCGVQTVGQDPQKGSHDSQRILLHRNVLFLLCFILIIYNIFLTESWLQPRKASKKIFKLNNLRGAVNAKFNTKQQVKVAVFLERIIYIFYRFTCCLKKLDSGLLLRFYNLM